MSTFLRKFSAEKDARVMKKIREYQAMYPAHSDGLTEEHKNDQKEQENA